MLFLIRGVPVQTEQEWRMQLDFIEEIPEPPTYRRIDLQTLERDAPKLDRVRIEYEGFYRSGFENSWLDETIWMSPATLSRGDQPTPQGRVRVRGRLFTHGARYGHLGQARYLLVADQITPLAKPSE